MLHIYSLHTWHVRICSTIRIRGGSLIEERDQTAHRNAEIEKIVSSDLKDIFKKFRPTTLAFITILLFKMVTKGLACSEV